jgi:hypothetical protein
MTIPGFTGEASLGKMEESYRLTSETEAETGRVLPQGYAVVPITDVGGIIGWQLVYCDISGGCFVIPTGARTLV